MSIQDPGLDRHEWSSRFESIERDLRDGPLGALPELPDPGDVREPIHGFTAVYEHLNAERATPLAARSPGRAIARRRSEAHRET